MLTLPILIAATTFYPHHIRNAEDALETTYEQIYGPVGSSVTRKAWDAANGYTAKKVGNTWILTSKDESMVVTLDAQTGKSLAMTKQP